MAPCSAERLFETSFPVALFGREFCFLLTKVLSERTISLVVGYDEFSFGIVVMVSKSAHSGRVFSVGGERLRDNLADFGLCRC